MQTEVKRRAFLCLRLRLNSHAPDGASKGVPHMPGRLGLQVPLSEGSIQAAGYEGLGPINGVLHPGQAADAQILLARNHLQRHRRTTVSGSSAREQRPSHLMSRSLSRLLAPVVSCQASHAREHLQRQARDRQSGLLYSPHELGANLSWYCGMHLLLLAYPNGHMQQSEQDHTNEAPSGRMISCQTQWRAFQEFSSALGYYLSACPPCRLPDFNAAAFMRHCHQAAITAGS